MSHSIDSSNALTVACESTWIASTEFYATHSSTNDRGLEIAKTDLSRESLPLLVLAKEQTAGRGRGENVWWATDGALTFSLLLDPIELGFAPERWGTLSLATAMAVSRTLLSFSPPANVAWKWPNDVFVGDQKICGILLEAPSTRPPRMVVGVGINVNNALDDIVRHDKNLRDSTISLSAILGEPVRLADVLRSFLNDFADVTAELRKDPLHLSRLWSERDYLHGREVVMKVGEHTKQGIAAGVDATGAMLVETSTGNTEAIPGGIVTHYE